MPATRPGDRPRQQHHRLQSRRLGHAAASALAVGRAPLPMHQAAAGLARTARRKPGGKPPQQALREATATGRPGPAGGALHHRPARNLCADRCQRASRSAPALLWMDERCRELLPEIDRRYGKDRIHQETRQTAFGQPVAGQAVLAAREPARAIRSQIAHVLDVHAFLAHRLTGRFVTSWGCADPMGLFDMRHNSWNANLIEALGLRLESVPEARSQSERSSAKSNRAALAGRPGCRPVYRSSPGLGMARPPGGRRGS